jgi:hypothetical protein
MIADAVLWWPREQHRYQIGRGKWQVFLKDGNVIIVRPGVGRSKSIQFLEESLFVLVKLFTGNADTSHGMRTVRLSRMVFKQDLGRRTGQQVFSRVGLLGRQRHIYGLTWSSTSSFQLDSMTSSSPSKAML